MKFKALQGDHYPRDRCAVSRCKAQSEVVDATHRFSKVDVPMCCHHFSERPEPEMAELSPETEPEKRPGNYPVDDPPDDHQTPIENEIVDDFEPENDQDIVQDIVPRNRRLFGTGNTNV